MDSRRRRRSSTDESWRTKNLEKTPQTPQTKQPQTPAKAKGKRRPASGWIETRAGNKHRKPPSISKAESLISLSRHQIKQLVDRAETARATDRRCTLQLGADHQFVPPAGNLQINWQRWKAVLALPPEQWEGLE